MKRRNRAGIILLVVLSMLTFFSLLVVTYLVFSSQARKSSFAIATRNIKQPDHNLLLDEALMTLIRGTSDSSNPFFGEDLLSDYYGRTDAMSLTTTAVGAVVGATGFSDFRVLSTTVPELDDIFAGRLMTFQDGPAVNRTYRVIRSRSLGSNNHQLIVETEPDLDVTTIPIGASIWFNGVPRNALGLGFDGTNIGQNAVTQPYPITGTSGSIGFTLPAALQPNHLGSNVDKSVISSTAGSDYDESYDAADFNNWFLSHRHSDGTVIPSFHRPSVMNYILNQFDTWEPDPSGPRTAADYSDLVASLARGTMRPIPIARNQLRKTGFPTHDSIHALFSGGNSSFALRTALAFNDSTSVPKTSAAMRLNQLARSLIEGPWDVDNDSDGVPDSVWIDLGLPMFTSPDGKLIKPLIAPMIEDLSGRLNVNAHHNSTHLVDPTVVALSSDQAAWANTWTAPATQSAFRGLGYGPAEVALPLAGLADVVNDRQQYGGTALVADPTPGTDAADTLDVLRTGYRPRTHTHNGGFGYSSDPFGRGGVGIGLSGHLVAAVSGTAVAADDVSTTDHDETTDEALNDPYESDPSGRLAGDAMLTTDELEAILRSNEFDIDLLPSRLRNRISGLLASNPELVHALTTTSVSDNTPPTVTASEPSAFESIVSLLSTTDQTEIKQLIAPEIRLGRKLDLNRPLGNQVDDNANGVIDEPLEVTVFPEAESFAVPAAGAGTIPTAFQGQAPDYNFAETTTVDGRQLLARHLYVLMMALTSDAASAPFPVTGGTPFTPSEEASYKARRIAQWAVNVVDYRDPDSIMTPFEYDEVPGDGWDVDGYLVTDESTTPPATDGYDNDQNGTVDDELPATTVPRKVVWGCESPELMFSESLALHDVRVRDTNNDTDTSKKKDDTTNPDNDSDQVRIPQGSLFLELYCPHPTVTLTDQQSKPALPQELYNAEGFLDLAATAPPLGAGSGAPVWRIAISEPHANSATADPDQVLTDYPDTASFQLEEPEELGRFSATKLNYERFIWFGAARNLAGPVDAAAALTSTDYANGTDVDTVITNNNISDMNGKANGVFFASDAVNGGNRRLLAPGQYLTLAPRQTTYLGSRSDGSGNPVFPSRQRFEALGTGLAHYRDGDGMADPPTEVRTSPVFGAAAYHTPPATLVVGSFLPAGGWTATSFQHGVVGLNVSEPLHSGYYGSIPTFQYNGTTGETVTPEDNDPDPGPDYPLVDAFLDLGNPSVTTALDVPLDVTAGRLPTVGDEPRLGTIPTYCSAYLQRLADPTLPFDPNSNPYRTVDWIQIDLTVFSGESEPDKGLGQGAAKYAERSRQRTGDGVNNLFSYECNDTDFSGGGSASVGEADTDELDFFHFTTGAGFLYSSLGFLNTQTFTSAEYAASPAAPATAAEIAARGHCNIDFVGFTPSIGSSGSALTGHDRNLPQTAFAVHPWLNRPFATPFELVMVPTCSQGRLFEEFGIVTAANPTIYPTAAINATEVYAPFRHMFNFFHATASGTAPGNNVARLFEFVNTMPQYRGEVEMVNPARVLGVGNPLAEMMTPPFNYLYDNRRQGRINLNTLSEPIVWEGLMQGHLSTGGGAGQFTFDQFNSGRRGYPTTAASPTTELHVVDTAGSPRTGPFNYDRPHLDSELPTQFAGVFTDAQRANLAPILRVPPDDAADTAAQNRLRRKVIDGTLFRQHFNMPQLADTDVEETITPSSFPAFVRDDAAAPLLPHLHRGRNPFMRYQTLMRMPNLVSDNSQVFVIRLTLGFFEVDASNVNSLGAEYNEAIGENQRYQALFIVDRSIPVGFVPGQDLNAHDTVIFERFYQ